MADTRTIPQSRWAPSAAAMDARLSYASYVSVRHRYVYFETPKVACTTMKHFIHGVEDCPELQFRPTVESRLSMLIHIRDGFGMPSFAELGPETLSEASTGDSYFRFCFVRNPYERLLSAWYDKVWLGEPGYVSLRRDLLSQIPQSADQDARKIEHFRAFVHHVAEKWDPLTVDHHWCPQVNLLYPDVLKYSMVGRLETFQRDFDSFTGWLRSRGYDGPTTLRRGNESMGLVRREKYFDETTAALATRMFTDDLSVFEYDKDSWRAIGEKPRATPDVEEWEESIAERNACLEALVWHLAHVDPPAVTGKYLNRIRPPRMTE